MCELVDPSHPDHAPEYLDSLEPIPAESYPPLATQAIGLVGSLATWALGGFPVAPAAERDRRQAICSTCDAYDPEARRCRACGCFGDLKPWLGTATCPRGLWELQTSQPQES